MTMSNNYIMPNTSCFPVCTGRVYRASFKLLCVILHQVVIFSNVSEKDGGGCWLIMSWILFLLSIKMTNLIVKWVCGITQILGSIFIIFSNAIFCCPSESVLRCTYIYLLAFSVAWSKAREKPSRGKLYRGKADDAALPVRPVNQSSSFLFSENKLSSHGL